MPVVKHRNQLVGRDSNTRGRTMFDREDSGRNNRVTTLPDL